jgi:hypothetical protein
LDDGIIVGLSPGETRDLLGSDTPDQADFLRNHTCGHVDRWTGRRAVLYQDGKPHEFAFWGIFGD